MKEKERNFCCICDREILVDGTFETVFQGTHRRIITEGKGGRSHVLLTGSQLAAALRKVDARAPISEIQLVYKDPPVVEAPVESIDEQAPISEPSESAEWFNELLGEGLQ